jgi:protein involved in polysaccharide export with SLBB domain
MTIIRLIAVFLLASLMGLATVIVTTPVVAQDVVPVSPETLDPTRYQLGSGDKVKVTVYGEEDLSGEFELDGSGLVALPLIGPVAIGGKDLAAAENLISIKLKDGYLINPRVSIEVLNYRPFYILGEVKKPIALASGFTYRASEKKIIITRKVDGVETKVTVEDTTLVLPGDIIRVPERFF